MLAACLGMTVTTATRAEDPKEYSPQARQRYDQGRDLQKRGLFADAIAAYEEAIKLGMKDYPRAHLYRADSFRDLQQYDKAIANYTKFIDEFGIEESCRY